MLRAPQIQNIVNRQRHDTPDQLQEVYVVLAEWIHRVAANPENAKSTMRGRQGYADPRAETHSRCPFLESRKSLFCIPIGSMEHVLAIDSRPGGHFFHRKVRHRYRTLAP